jgi:peroxiredoxin (alkyl hydroperoxide reductase subunit C)
MSRGKAFGQRQACAGGTMECVMASANQPNLMEVDWSKIPAPPDDGSARHLAGMTVPDVSLAATDGSTVSLAKISGRVVVFAYPRTGVPGQPSLVDDWDMIPGARGCTPQTCAFRDLHKVMIAAGAARVFGLSTQDTAYQKEAAERMHLPFPLLSDEKLALSNALRLPMMQVADMTLIKRLALVIDDGRIAKVFYPVFPPNRNAGEVLAWLEQNRR